MKFMLRYYYQTNSIGKILFQSELLTTNHVLELADELEKKLNVKLTFVDVNDSEWLKREVMKLMEKEMTEPTKVVVYFDGGYDKQTKDAGIGVCIYYSQNGKCYRIRKNKLINGLDNNNEAEYAALEYAINELSWLEVKQQEVTFKGDSQVVLQQLLGEWAVYEDSFHHYIDNIEQHLSKYQITPVYEILHRNENREAHKLATQALERIEIESTIEIDGGK